MVVKHHGMIWQSIGIYWDLLGFFGGLMVDLLDLMGFIGIYWFQTFWQLFFGGC